MISLKKTFFLSIILIAVLLLTSCKKTTKTKTVSKEPTTVSTTSKTFVDSLDFLNYQENYFVGAPFNKTKGSIKVTQKNGLETTIDFSNSSIKIEGFDTSTAGENKEANVTYKSGGTTITKKLKYNVYEVQEVELVKPTKLEYYNYDLSINYDGGSLVLYSTDKKYSESLPLDSSEIEITGYDLSLVTDENVSTPKELTITVSYKNFSKDFTVNVYYDQSSKILVATNELSSLNFSSITTIDESKATIAKEAYELYSSLTDDGKSKISKQDLSYILRTLAVYYFEKWSEFKDTYSDLLEVKLDENNNYFFDFLVDDDVDGFISSTNTIKNDNELKKLIEDCEVLRNEDVSNNLRYRLNNLTINNYLSEIFTLEKFNNELQKPQDLIALYNSVSGISKNYSIDDLDDSIEDVLEKTISFSKKYTIEDTQKIINWREDYFDIIYDYYFKESKLNDPNIKELTKIKLTSELEELYIDLMTTYESIAYYQAGEKDRVEAVYFMYYYKKSLNSALEILEANSASKYLYANYPYAENEYFADLFKHVNNDEGGYQTIVGVGYSDSLFNTLWAEYVNLYEPFLNGISLDDEGIYFYFPYREEYERKDGKEFDKDKYKEDVISFYEKYVEAPISTQLSFKASIATYNAELSYFNQLIQGFYSEFLDEKAYNIFNLYYNAVELNYTRFANPNASKSFYEQYNSIKEREQSLTNEELENLKTLTNNCFEALDYYYDRTDSTTFVFGTDYDLGEYEETFNELIELCKEFVWLDRSSGLTDYKCAIITNYAKIFNLRYKILSSGNKDVVDAYYSKVFEISQAERYTPDYFVGILQASFAKCVNRNVNGTSYQIIDFYNDYPNIQSFLPIAYSIYRYDFVKDYEIDQEEIEKVLTSYYALTTNERYIFINVFDNDNNFFNSLSQFFYNELERDDSEETIQTIISSYISAEVNYITYFELQDEEIKENYYSLTISLIEDAKEIYENSLSEKGKLLFKFLYDHYTELYNDFKK